MDGLLTNKINNMLNDDILDGICCSICYDDFKDTEGARISHGYPVVCHDCWSKLSKDKKQALTKAFFYTQGYVFNIVVPYQQKMVDLTIKPLHNIDQIIYEVYDDRLMCAVGLNDRANWDADRAISSHLIYEIGKAIEVKERD